MAIPAYIADAFSGLRARVLNGGMLSTAVYHPPAPAVGTANRQRYFFGRLGSSGLDSGTVNMNVNASSGAQEFYVESHNDYDIHIQRIVVLIADSSVVHNKFGGTGPLTNGWDLVSTEAGVDTKLIDEAKTGGEVIAQSGIHMPYGDSATVCEVVNWTSGDDAQIVALPIGEYVPGGLRIGRGTKDRLSSIVRDDLTGLTEFYVYLYGYKNYE